MTTTQYFKDVTTVEAIKHRYRNLARANHPDLGGDVEVMQEINAQYQSALKGCDGTTSQEGRTYRYKAEVEQELTSKLLELLKLPQLDVGLIGYWIWVTGDTKPHKDALKAAGLNWHSKRKCWYYKPQGWKRSKQSNADLTELASKYGYRGFQSGSGEQLPITQD